MKIIRVVAAIIIHNDKIFATERGYGEFKGKWEFPGGKIETDETPQQALIREIKEELEISIRIGELLDTVEYDYPSFHLSMDCFICNIESGKVVLREHSAAKWLTKDNLESVNWLQADLGVVNKLKEYLSSVYPQD